MHLNNANIQARIIPYTGNIWQGEILENHAVKAIGEENFGE